MSIVMATCDGERFLVSQLRSLAEQTHLPDELVVVDDASRQGTLDLLAVFARTAPFAVHVHRNERRLGSNATFEAALGRATGDVLLLADQDDEWEPTKLAVIAQRFQERPGLGLVFSEGRIIDERGDIAPERLWERVGFTAVARSDFRADPFAYLVKHAAVTGCTMAFRAELLPCLTPIPDLCDPGGNAMHHDRWFSILLSALTEVDFVEEPLVRYRLHPGQQVGLPAGRSVLEPSRLWGKRSLAQVAPRMALQGEYLGRIAGRLEAVPISVRPSMATRLEERAAHLRARSALDPRRRKRCRVIWGEWRGGRYRAHSLGYRSAVADLVRLG